jgi:gamma-glutamyltranspeptidase
MRDQFSNTQAIRKPAVTSKGGIVAAQSGRAAQVGAEVLAAGGDCVDAVIATTFALGVLEPWMSGVGGGGAMVLYRAHEDRYEVIDYGMRAPGSLRVEDYPLTGDEANFIIADTAELQALAHYSDDDVVIDVFVTGGAAQSVAGGTGVPGVRT